jgi:transposase
VTVADILSLPGWAVRSIEEREDHLIIEASVIEMPSVCPLCGSVFPPYRFGHRPYHIADLPIRMKPVIVLAHRRRYRCRDCASTFLDRLPGVHPQHDATCRLVSYIESQSLHLTATFTSLAASLGISDKLVRNIFTARIARLEREYEIQTPCYLGIDEIYLDDTPYCVLTDLQRHAALDLLPKRDMKTVKGWLSQLQSKETVAALAIDLWKPYRTAAREILPHAVIVADKYHVLRLANEVVETVRKAVRSEMTPAASRQLKQDRKILLKRAHDLTDQQKLILESWMGLMPILHDLYRVKEEFFEIYDAADEQEAWDRYIAWQGHLPKTLYDAFLALQLTVEEWGQEIFAFWSHPITNAFTERTNLSIRESSRLAYGLSYRTMRAKLLFSPANTAKLARKLEPVQPQETSVCS